jgi:transcriptional regulator with XRE-family HTH domain
MQALFVSQDRISESRPYDAAMHPGGRPTTKPRTSFGERLAAARERAGISQRELAEKLETDQQRVAYWERHATGFRSEAILAQIAEILSVSADELLGRPVSRRNVAKPSGRARQIFDAVSRLPRRQQEKIFDILQPFVREHVGETVSTR